MHKDLQIINGRAVVVGLGKTGIACARFFKNIGVEVSITDSRNNPPELEQFKNEFPDSDIALGGFDTEMLLGANVIAISPGVSLREPELMKAAMSGIRIWGEIEIFARFANARVIAITGSNGKSTVTTLVAKILEKAGMKVAVGGNLGTPAVSLITKEVPDFYVIEVSSFQLESTFSLCPASAVILNVSEDHMDRYSSIEEYTAAKKRVIRGYGDVIVNIDDAVTKNLVDSIEPTRKTYTYTLNEPQKNGFGIAKNNGEDWICFEEKPVMPVSEIKIPGLHNQSNALAAMALTYAVDIEFEPMVAALKEFDGLDHRTQWVAESNGVEWYNDSKATNVGATLAAVNGMGENLMLIMGGDGKGSDFTPLAKGLNGRVKLTVLIGRDAELIEKAIGDATTVKHAGTMKEAVQIAHQEAISGDRVLLSPACASWDMFNGYAERGEEFIKQVKNVIEKEGAN